MLRRVHTSDDIWHEHWRKIVISNAGGIWKNAAATADADDDDKEYDNGDDNVGSLEGGLSGCSFDEGTHTHKIRAGVFVHLPTADIP